MRHRISGRKLGRNTSHRKALGRALVTNLFIYGRIITTAPKAKEYRGLVDKLVTIAKKGGLANYRRALSVIYDKRVTQKLFTDIQERFKNRPGGFTRILRLGDSRWEGDGHGKFAMNRLGDNAHRVIWELVERREPDEERFLAGRGPRARDARDKAATEKKTTDKKTTVKDSKTTPKK